MKEKEKINKIGAIGTLLALITIISIFFTNCIFVATMCFIASLTYYYSYYKKEVHKKDFFGTTNNLHLSILWLINTIIWIMVATVK